MSYKRISMTFLQSGNEILTLIILIKKKSFNLT